MNTFTKNLRQSGARVTHPFVLSLMLAASLVCVPLATIAQTPSTPTAPRTVPAESGSTGANPSMDMRASMQGMQEKMSSMKTSGDIDHDFAAMMRIHHQGAVDMAQMELNKGKDPTLRDMAKEIIAAQKKEIAEFDQWLAKNKK